MKIIDHKVEVIQRMENPVDAVARAARTCYKSEDKASPENDRKLVRNLIKRGHEAMLEFADITFRITTDRGISHELVRHRLASWAQVSTRYVDYEGKDIEFIKPIQLEETTQIDLNAVTNHAYRCWVTAMETAEKCYQGMRDAGTTPQTARSVLPNSLATEINMKMNMRSLRNFIKLRANKAAHPDMQFVAGLILDWLLADEDYCIFFEEYKHANSN